MATLSDDMYTYSQGVTGMVVSTAIDSRIIDLEIRDEGGYVNAKLSLLSWLVKMQRYE
jgi:hypothetical protein